MTALLLSACGSESTPPASAVEGEAAVWDIDAHDPLPPSTQRFTALVSRLECANGVTGRVLAPHIELTDTQVIVTFSVENNREGDATCPSNNWVKYDVDLGEPLGNRDLIDGTCQAGGEAATTSFCSDSVRSDGNPSM